MKIEINSFDDFFVNFRPLLWDIYKNLTNFQECPLGVFREDNRPTETEFRQFAADVYVEVQAESENNPIQIMREKF